VLAGGLDAALVPQPISDTRIDAVFAYEEELVLVSSRHRDPLASLDDLASSNVLAFHPGCPHRDRMELLYGRRGLSMTRVVEMTSYHAMLGCSLAGMGVALMPLSVLETYSERGHLTVRHIPDPDIACLRTLLVWRRDSPRAKVAGLARCLNEGPYEGRLS
jgi:DNA-binding transcriptional LysR family regulator